MEGPVGTSDLMGETSCSFLVPEEAVEEVIGGSEGGQPSLKDQEVVDLVGEDLSEIDQELQKLALQGAEGPLGAPEVREMVTLEEALRGLGDRRLMFCDEALIGPVTGSGNGNGNGLECDAWQTY